MWIPSNFLSLPPEQSDLNRARVVVLPVPYDSTASFKTGAREGPRAIIDASSHLEDYDPELDVDVAEIRIHTAPFIEPNMEGPARMISRVKDAVQPFIDQGKLMAVLGGEHSISVGVVKALLERYADLSVLYLDAHADMRDEYMGTRWGHASVARRIYELCPLVQVGVRSLSIEEKDFISSERIRSLHWPAEQESWSANTNGLAYQGGPPIVDEIIGGLSENVYVSIDSDVLDPSIMAAVGTPEPGGMDWHQITSLLRAVTSERNIVGFDVTELNPSEGPTACAYTAAKLVYKLIAYATILPKNGPPRDSMRNSTQTG